MDYISLKIPNATQRASCPKFGSTKFFELTALKYAKLVVDLKLTIGNDCTCSNGRRRPTKYGKSVETPIFCTFCERKDTK